MFVPPASFDLMSSISVSPSLLMSLYATNYPINPTLIIASVCQLISFLSTDEQISQLLRPQSEMLHSDNKPCMWVLKCIT